MASLLGAALLGGCLPGPGDRDAIGPPPGPRPGPSPVATPVTTAGDLGAGCAPAGDGVPDTAASGPSVDVDGDGRGDRLWLGSPSEGPRMVGLTTASGATTSQVVHLSGPVPLKAIAVDADEQPPVEVLVTDGRAVAVFAMVDCTLRQVRSATGEAYLLDLGFRERGTGAGCIDADQDGRRDLVSFLRTSADPLSVTWKRTIVRLRGAEASTGITQSGTFREPQDHERIQALTSVSCGPLTIDDGVSEPRPDDGGGDADPSVRVGNR